MSKKSAKIWPYSIVISITLVFIACVATIVIANKLPVEKSDTYMMGYHEADAKANEILKSAIEFNKRYKIEYISDELSSKNCIVKYRVMDSASSPVNNADIKIVITRPNNHKYDQELSNPVIENGIYTFRATKLPQEGRWDIMAKVKVEDIQRFYNIKADTRSKEVIEY
ncbi:FixH family protein [Sulfurimonas xiamenensis]|uniref:YtkA-like domain-containing protein n=1 Tax=Sulfurimonas xiamenensis TaxID=2590021 RepID=A0AAJ4A5D7_9BACT|nr:FixH family protein [Sulfurimonas xiamenensis]PLY16688.1 MAG: hypothetical protein C0628_00115 [Sulfurimonas sp.]QFR44038.1 hypothetical protein FJR47_08940 [Sulfurimonas xiamenensis]